MAALLLFCIPLTFCAYAFNLEERQKHFIAFFTGIFVGAVFFLIRSFLFPNLSFSTDTLKSYFFSVFFIHLFIPICLGAIAGFAVSCFDFLAIPAALFGVFTVNIYHFIFLTSRTSHILPIVLYLIVYTAALFSFDGLVRLCCDITFYFFAAFLVCFVLFLIIVGIGVIGIGLYYFNSSPLVYCMILGTISTGGLCLHFFVHRGGVK